MPISLFEKYSNSIKENYSQYLNGLVNKGDNVALVADMGHKFSALKLVRLFVDNPVRGVFFVNSGKLLDENNSVFAHSQFLGETVFSKSNVKVFL